MKRSPRFWLGFIACYFWSAGAMRVGAYLIAQRTEWTGQHLTELQRTFYLRGISIDVSAAVGLTTAYLVWRFLERRGQTVAR